MIAQFLTKDGICNFLLVVFSNHHPHAPFQLGIIKMDSNLIWYKYRKQAKKQKMMMLFIIITLI